MIALIIIKVTFLLNYKNAIQERTLNKLFIFLGSLIVCFLAALLVAPLFINWSDHKAIFEREASRFIGQPVKVKGAASARFLPIPTFTFTDIVVGSNASLPLMSANHLSLRLELIPLLQKNLEIIDMTLQSPQASLQLDEKGHTNWHQNGKAITFKSADTIKLGPVKINNGAFYIADKKSGKSLKLNEINAELSAQSLIGPWKISGQTETNNQQVNFQLSTGKYQNKSLRTKLKIITDEKNLDTLLDGNVTLENDISKIAYKGKITIKPSTKKDAQNEGTIPWVLSGLFDLNRQGFSLDKASFDNQSPTRPLNLTGKLKVPFSPHTKAQAQITSRQIDLDRLYKNKASQNSSLSEINKHLTQFFKNLPTPPFKSTFNVSLPTIITGGDLIKGLRFKAEPTRDTWQISQFHAHLPGQSKLHFNGRIKTEEEALEGFLKIESEKPNNLVRWIHSKKQGALPKFNAERLSFSTHFLAEKNALQLNNLEVDFGSSDFSGSIAINHFSNNQKRYAALLTASVLDLDTFTTIGHLLINKEKPEDKKTKNYNQLDLKLTAKELKSHNLIGRDAVIDLALTGETITVTKLDIADFAGLELTLTGNMKNSFSRPEGRIRGKLKAREKGGLLKLGEILAPNHPLTAHFDNHAKAFIPLNLSVDFSGKRQEETSNFSMALQGKAGKADLKTNFDFKGNFKHPYQGYWNIDLQTSHEKTAELLAQSGLLVLDIDQPAKAELTLKAKGKAENGLKVNALAHLQGVDLKSTGSLTVNQNKAPHYKGSFMAETEDGEPLLRQLGFTLPESGFGTEIHLSTSYEGNLKKGSFSNFIGVVNGSDIKGNLKFERNKNWHWQGNIETERLSLPWLSALVSGTVINPINSDNLNENTIEETEESVTDNFENPPLTAAFWSQDAYGKPYLQNTHAQLKVTTHSLGLTNLREVQKTRFNLALNPSSLKLSNIKGQFEKGALTGNLSFQNNEGLISLDGLVNLEKAETDNLLWHDEDRPLIEGHLSLSTKFNSKGRSLDAVIDKLSGQGTIMLEKNRLRRLNPQTFSLFQKAADNKLSLDEKTLNKLAKTYLDAGSLKIEKLEAPFILSSGIARFSNVTQKEDWLQLRLSGAVNLPEMTLNGSLAFTSKPEKTDRETSSGTAPEIALLFNGPINQPERRFDLKPLQNYLTVRRFEEEVQKVELLQADILEKQRLSRYLRWIKTQEELEKAEEIRKNLKKKKQEETKRRSHIKETSDKNQIIKKTLPPLDLNKEILRLEKESLSLKPASIPSRSQPLDLSPR